MNKKEILKYIMDSKNIKMDLKRTLTDKNMNFDWNIFFNLYDEYFSDKPYLNLEYNSGNKNSKISDISSFVNITNITLINDNEMQILYNVEKKEEEMPQRTTSSQSSSISPLGMVLGGLVVTAAIGIAVAAAMSSDSNNNQSNVNQNNNASQNNYNNNMNQNNDNNVTLNKINVIEKKANSKFNTTISNMSILYKMFVKLHMKDSKVKTIIKNELI